MLIVILVSALEGFSCYEKRKFESNAVLRIMSEMIIPFWLITFFWIKNYIIFTVTPRRDGRSKVRFKLMI